MSLCPNPKPEHLLRWVADYLNSRGLRGAACRVRVADVAPLSLSEVWSMAQETRERDLPAETKRLADCLVILVQSGGWKAIEAAARALDTTRSASAACHALMAAEHAEQTQQERRR